MTGVFVSSGLFCFKSHTSKVRAVSALVKYSSQRLLENMSFIATNIKRTPLSRRVKECSNFSVFFQPLYVQKSVFISLVGKMCSCDINVNQ